MQVSSQAKAPSESIGVETAQCGGSRHTIQWVPPAWGDFFTMARWCFFASWGVYFMGLSFEMYRFYVIWYVMSQQKIRTPSAFVLMHWRNNTKQKQKKVFQKYFDQNKMHKMCTLPETSIAPENKTSIFRCENVSFREWEGNNSFVPTLPKYQTYQTSGQITIIPKPELRGLWEDSLTKPPFKVTSAEVVIICPETLQKTTWKTTGVSQTFKFGEATWVFSPKN